MKAHLLSITSHPHSPAEAIQCRGELGLSQQDGQNRTQGSGRLLGENLSEVYLNTCPKTAPKARSVILNIHQR